MRSGMKWLPTLMAATLLSIGAAGCGASKDNGSPSQSASNPSPSTAAPATITSPATSPHGYLNDGDNDPIGDADNDNNHDNDNDNSEDHVPNDNSNYHDSDDRGILAFGHAASAADKRAMTALVKRYYTVAAAVDGPKACAMLAPRFAESIVEDYGKESPGPSYLRSGTTCPAVMALLFQHFRAQIAAPFDVTSVRVERNQAYALLGSKATPARYITLERRRKVWWIGALIGNPLL
jgi:hypothetical protein